MKTLITVIFFMFILNCRIGLLAEDGEVCQTTCIPNSIREKIRLIDSKDIPILEDLFRNLFCECSFPYTLFGFKPMSAEGDCLNSYHEFISKATKTKVLIRLLGWKTWQKYSHLFPSKHFYFKTPDFIDPENLSYRIVNKQSCEEIIRKHLSIFQSCMETDKSIQEIVNDICSSSFFSLYNHKKGFTTCLGLLFGYGEKNSRACERRNILLIQLLYQAPYHLDALSERMKQRQGYFHMGLQSKESIEGLEQPISIQSVITELNELQEVYHPFALVEQHYLCPLESVRCAGMSEDPEAKELKARYEKTTQQLVDIYNSENFLELVLTQLSL